MKIYREIPNLYVLKHVFLYRQKKINYYDKLTKTSQSKIFYE